MPFKPGNRCGQQRKKFGGGRPTREEAEEKKLKAEVAREIIERNATKLANRLVKDAMTEKGRKSLHVAINKLVSDAKQEVQHSGDVGVRPWLVDVDPRLEKKKDESK
jgi:hypothetical protein